MKIQIQNLERSSQFQNHSLTHVISIFGMGKTREMEADGESGILDVLVEKAARKKAKKAKKELVSEVDAAELEGSQNEKKDKKKKKKKKNAEELEELSDEKSEQLSEEPKMKKSKKTKVREEEQGDEKPKKKRKKESRDDETKSKKSKLEEDSNYVDDEDMERKLEKMQGPIDDEDDKRYSTNILFVGQLPFHATIDHIKEHFSKHGVADAKVRLLTDKKTKKPRGIAFVEVDNSRQLVNALRVHHTRLLGRMINVERTCGGGGNNDKRKEKLSNLRKMQGKKVLKEVSLRIEEVLSLNPGTEVSVHDFDERVVEALGSFPRDIMENIVTEFVNSVNLQNITNKSAWIMGMVKRYREKQHEGEDFKPDPKKQGKHGGGKNHGGKGGGGSSNFRKGKPPSGRPKKPSIHYDQNY